MPEQARGPSGPQWDGVNITWSRAADPGGSAARDDLPALWGMGEVWSGPRRLATVYYELRGTPDTCWETGRPVLRNPQGTITGLLGDWWTVQGMQEVGEELHLRDGQRLPFLMYGGVRTTLHIRALRTDMSLVLPTPAARATASPHRSSARQPSRSRRTGWSLPEDELSQRMGASNEA